MLRICPYALCTKPSARVAGSHVIRMEQIDPNCLCRLCGVGIYHRSDSVVVDKGKPFLHAGLFKNVVT